MQYRQIPDRIQKSLKNLVHAHVPLESIVDRIASGGGVALLVGGAVRDLFLGHEIKDLDIEIHHLTIDQLQLILSNYGPVSCIGKAYGVLRIHGLSIDWSLPRRDDAGRKPIVSLHADIDMRTACARRDLTINAMAINLKTYELIDPFNGLQDLKDGVLRAPDVELFVQDPLRFYRVMQFIGRFNARPDKALTDVCMRMDISAVSCERIEQEFNKLFLKSIQPSRGLRWIMAIGRMSEVLCELQLLRGVMQNKQWHPEGDVFEHTMQAVDAAAAIGCTYADESQRLLLIYGLLCHDLGKITATHVVNGIIKSERHAVQGVPLARRMMSRLTKNHDRIDGVCTIVRYHMEPGQFVTGNAGHAAYKRLASKCAPHVTLGLLADVARADKRGRNPDGLDPLTTDDPRIVQFLKHARAAGVIDVVEQPLLQGRDIADLVAPGPEMGDYLRVAYELQIEEDFTNKDELKTRLAALIRKN